jgi:serine protease Do
MIVARHARWAPPLLLLSSLVLAVPDATAQPKAPVAYPDALERVNDSIDALTRKAWPSVVQIQVTSFGVREEATGGETSAVVGRQQGVGSGFVIDADGYIMTNAHVVANAQRVQVLLSPTTSDGSLATALSPKLSTVPARIVGLSSELDIALLKVDGRKLPALGLATYSQLRQGETVFAFGSPAGLRHTLTHGLVSSVARQIDPDSPLIYVQTDAPINPGNSGGPLVNVRGEVVGMNTFILSSNGGSDGLSFAVPSATIRTAFRQLRQYGQLRRQEMGLSLQTITPEIAAGLRLARDQGVIISDVWPNGPAEAAGLKPGDVLVSVDGQPAENVPTVNYTFRLRESQEPVKLVIQRGATEAAFSVTAVEQKSDFDTVAAMADPQKNLVAELGLLGVEIDPRMVDQASGLRDPYGIVVAARAAGAASEVPVQARDVIRSLNDTKMFTLEQLRNAVRDLKPGSPITLQIQREGRLMYVSFTRE